MQIIMGKENAALLRERYTLLELETFEWSGTAYCVLAPEDIALTDMPDLERLCRLHQALIDALNRGDYATVSEALPHLIGRFSGSVDTFYDIIGQRIKDTSIAN